MTPTTTPIQPSIFHLEETTSTNDYLHAYCQEHASEEFTTICTESQTAGKGQRGNTWESEKNKNLLFSTLVYPSFLEAKEQFYLSILTALSVTNILSSYTDCISIKWPNDIYWKDKKIAGILIENEIQGKTISQSIIGIGLNVNQENFLSNAPNPISLKQILGISINKELLLMKIRDSFIQLYNELKKTPELAKTQIQQSYIEKLYRRDGFHLYQDTTGIFKARFHHLLPTGHLCLEDEQGNIRTYAFKEIKYTLHE